MFWMAWNGEMYPCGMLSDYAVKPSEGGMDFADMWRQIHTRTEAIYLPAACMDCALRRICPSCAAVTQSNHGDTAKLVEGMCTYTKTYVNTFLELMDTAGDGGEVTAVEGGDVDPFVCL